MPYAICPKCNKTFRITGTTAEEDAKQPLEVICFSCQQDDDGVYAIPIGDQPKVKIRALYNFCKQHGKSPDQLTEEEMENFLDYD